MGLILKRRLALLLVLTVLAGWLRVWNIGNQSLWFDEVFSRNVAIEPNLWAIAQNGVAGDVHPPLYFMLLNGWEHLTGQSEVALRMLSALIAMLGVPAFYHFARLLFDERVGLVALALGVIAPFQVYYAQEARQYALSITCATWAMVGLLALLQGKRYGWRLYVIAGVAGLYTHYFSVLMLIAVHAWLVVYPPARQQWRRWLSADVLIGLLFVPQVFIFLSQTQAVFGGFWITRPILTAPLVTLTYLLFSTTLAPLPPLLAILVEGLLIATLAVAALDIFGKAPRKMRPYWLLCMIVLIGVLIPSLLISLVATPIYLDRSFGMLSPFLLAALAAAFVTARAPSPTRILIGILAVLMCGGTILHALTPDPAKPPYRQIAADLLNTPDAEVVPVLTLSDSAYLPLTYYAPTLEQQLVDVGEKSWLFPKTWQLFNVQRLTRDQLAEWLRTYRGKLRVIEPNTIDKPELATLHDLERNACTKTGKTYNQIVIVYEFTLGPCLAWRPPM